MTQTIATAYSGPQCPHCSAPLSADEIRTGTVTCMVCSRPFEATAFTPPARKTRVMEVIAAGPEGAAACANHARNAAVTSCQRCGLFICALCDMNVGEGSFCPACFERVRAEGALKGASTRFRDYGSMARVAAVVGVLFTLFSAGFLGLPFGAITCYYARKGIQQRRQEGQGIGGMVVAMIFGSLQILGGLAMIGFMIWAFTRPGGT